MKNLTKAFMKGAVNHVVKNASFKPGEITLLKGYGRQGLQEIRNALYQDSRIAADVDYGIWGRATPGEVSQERADTEPKNLLQAEQEKIRQQLAPEPKPEKEMEK